MTAHRKPLSTCTSCPMNRRAFLELGGAAALGAIGLLSTAGCSLPSRKRSDLRLRIIYALHGEIQDVSDWPHKAFDFRPAMESITNTLQTEFKDWTFLTSQARGKDDAKKILENDKTEKIDGYVVVQMNNWNIVAHVIAKEGKPVLYVDYKYGGSGGFLVYNADFLRKGTSNVGFIASSRMQDLVEAVKCFDVAVNGGGVAAFVAGVRQARIAGTPKAGNHECVRDDVQCLSSSECVHRLKESKILAVRSDKLQPGTVIMGVPLEEIRFSELSTAWEKADRSKVKAVADKWQKNARTIEEGISRETLEASAAMYLAQKALLKKHHANAITINCLSGFAGGFIHAYPCLGFHELLNEGLVGACECDERSAATQVVFTTLTQGRPGYISDPVIDTSKRQIVYAHCVASNRPFGPGTQPNPFDILTHSEDRLGASVRSYLPTGYMTTSLKVDQDKQMILMHRAVTLDTDSDDRGCRTKLCAEPVGDIEKLFTQWDKWSWHRVTFYGDLREQVYSLAEAVGWKVTEEA